MLPRHHPDRIRIAFDDHRLVTNGNVSSFYPPDVNSGKNSGVFAGPLAEFFPLWKKAGHKACCLSGWLNPLVFGGFCYISWLDGLDSGIWVVNAPSNKEFEGPAE